MIRMENSGCKWMSEYLDAEYYDTDRDLETIVFGDKEGLDEVFEGFIVGDDSWWYGYDGVTDMS